MASLLLTVIYLLFFTNYSYNLTEMRQVLRALVDPESENNDVDENEPWRPKPGVKEALRILRLVSPKCSEIVLRCVIGGSTKPCLELFKMVLTDSGYCCSFNSGMNRSTSQFGYEAKHNLRLYKSGFKFAVFISKQI